MQKNLQTDTGIYLVNSQPLSYDYMASKYKDYKEGMVPIEKLNEKEKKEVETLKILEKLGYSLTETGTYFYKDVIVKAIEQLQEATLEENYRELIIAINNDYSQFYFDIARNNYDVGLKTFHSCINISFQTRLQINKELQRKVGLDEYNMNYKQEALLIANHIIENQPRKEKEGIKKKVISY